MSEQIKMNRSESIAKLAAALAAAQAEIENVAKSSENPHFKSRYADLASIRAAIAPLSAHGIAVLQPVTSAGRVVTVETTLAHESGEWISSACSMTAADERPQTIGACITYARRYSLSGLVCLAAEDDDGNLASGKAPPPKSAPAPAFASIAEIAGRAPERLAAALKHYAVAAVEDLTPDQQRSIVEKINAAPKAAALKPGEKIKMNTLVGAK